MSSAAPDWDDVLRRARAGRGSHRARMAVLAAAVSLAAAVAVFPAAGLDRLFVASSPSADPFMTVVAPLRGAGIESGRFVLDLPRATGATLGGRLRPRRVRLFVPTTRKPRSVHWRLELRPTQDVREARILFRGATLARLCAPCRSGASGTLRLRIERLTALANGAGVVEVRTARGTVRGTTRLVVPPRP